MNRRTAKKVLKRGRPYTDLQLFRACLRLARYHRGRDEAREVQILRSIPYAFVEVDGALDLRRERLQGKKARRERGIPEPAQTQQLAGPVYRRDGQVHNFNAVNWNVAEKEEMTRKRYEARYGGANPAPKHNVGRLQD